MDIWIVSSFWAVVSNAAIQICVEVFVWIYVCGFLQLHLRVELLLSIVITLFDVLGKYWAIFQNMWTILHSHQQCMKVLVSPHPHQLLLLPAFKKYLPSLCMCEVVISLKFWFASLWSFIMLSISLLYSVATCISFLEKCRLKFFAYFKIELFDFLLLNYKSSL